MRMLLLAREKGSLQEQQGLLLTTEYSQWRKKTLLMQHIAESFLQTLCGLRPERLNPPESPIRLPYGGLF
ncbi:hypothetical protein EQ82_08560 [Klebsiella pneumoniae]|nr:hypothetical protein EQ82_08560 [Klebsiella pneumoniae]